MTPTALIATLLLAAGVTPVAGGPCGLLAPRAKEVAMELVSSFENSSLDWRRQYGYIEDIHDGRGYTAGIIGFTSGTGDMLAVVSAYARRRPGNALSAYLPALRRVVGSDSHRGLGSSFVAAWKAASADPAFRAAQERERDRVYFEPAVRRAMADGLGPLGQFAYYDAAVMHGPDGLAAIRRRAVARAPAPAAGGDEVQYLGGFLDERVVEMRKETAHQDVSRVETAQRRFLAAGNLSLRLPLRWAVYGDLYTISVVARPPGRRAARGQMGLAANGSTG